ncbi:MAG: amino acid permease [Tenericutes bacterium HGW-Tenericutes-6]|nr:MAG: amino acid permease [Tenericutes bacterium HGW-Tenericutes-6]
MSNLKKEIGLFGGISILAGIIIGSGIFALGSIVLKQVGFSIGLSLLAWAIGGIITLFSALTYAELGTMFPETGGHYVYLKKAYGKKVAFLSGLMGFVLSNSGSIAVLALIFSEVLSSLLPTANFIKPIAVILILGLTIVQFFGVKLGSTVQKIFMVAKILPIIAIIFIGLFLSNEPLNFSFSTAEPVSFITLLSMIGFGVIVTLWAYEGWTNLNVVAGEMKNVKKDLPKALSLSTGLVMVVYLLFIVAIYRMIDSATLLSVADQEGYIPMVAMSIKYGTVGVQFVLIAVLISIFGALNGSTMVFPRIYYAMAEDDNFFKSFKKVHPKYGTPYIAIIASGVMASILLVFDIRSLITFVAFGGLIFNTLIFISVFLFRKREPERERPYKVIFYPFVPIVAIIGLVLLLIAALIQSLIPSLIGFAVLVVGYFIYTPIVKRIKQ